MCDSAQKGRWAPRKLSFGALAGSPLRRIGRFIVDIAVSEVHAREAIMNLGRVLLYLLGWAMAMVVINAVYARSAD
jgi:hypothetical protein